MNIINTFKVAKEISEIAKRYDSEDGGTNEQADILRRQFINELDMLHSKLLQLGKFTREDVLFNEASNIKKHEDLLSHTKLDVHYIYENEKLALVEDTAMDLYLIPLDIINIHEQE